MKDKISGNNEAKAATVAPAVPAPTAAPAVPAPTAAAAAKAPVGLDTLDTVLAHMAKSHGGNLNGKTSIVDLMKLVGMDSSLADRKELATELGHTGALDGSAEMSIWLIGKVRERLAAAEV